MLAKILLFCASSCLAALFFCALRSMGREAGETTALPKVFTSMLPTLNYLATERLPPPDMRVFGTPKSPFSGRKELPGSRRAPISLFTEHSVNFLQSLRSIATRQLEHFSKAPVTLLRRLWRKFTGSPGNLYFAFLTTKKLRHHLKYSTLRAAHYTSPISHDNATRKRTHIKSASPSPFSSARKITAS